MGKKEKTRAWGVFPKTKRRKILIVCRCLRIPWLYLNSSRHLFEEWPTPHWLVPYTFWCRPPFQVYFQMHLLMLGTCSTTIQYELSLQFAQWVCMLPSFPHTPIFQIVVQTSVGRIFRKSRYQLGYQKLTSSEYHWGDIQADIRGSGYHSSCYSTT